MHIKGASVIISGGASGLGEAAARKLISLGAKVAILDQNSKIGKKIAKKIGAEFFKCDVTNEIEISDSIKFAQKKNGAISICISCAGIVQINRMIGKEGPMPLAEFDKTIRVNLIGTFNLMRLAAAEMIHTTPDKKGNRGIIINTASIAAFDGDKGLIAYSASKGGVVSMTLPAARELAQFGVRVMAIAPGPADTPMVTSLPRYPKIINKNSIPLFPNRLVKPEEYAALVQHIIENDMLNGSCIRLDGAMRMNSS